MGNVYQLILSKLVCKKYDIILSKKDAYQI